MQCTKCGQPLDPGAEFCGNCGQPVVLQQPVASTPYAQPGVIAPSDTQIMQQVMANPTPTPTTNFATPAAAAVSGGGRAVPAYAVAPIDKLAHKSEVLAVVGLVAGIIGIPGSIIPILGFVLGIVGLVCSTISRRQAKQVISLLGIIFSSLAIIASIALFVYAFNKDTHNSSGISTTSSVNSAGSGVNSSGLLTTPCFSMQLEAGMNTSGTVSGCSYSYPSGATNSVDFDVQSENVPDLTSSAFPQAAQAGFTNLASAGTVGPVKATTFAGSPAYEAQATLSLNNEYTLVTEVYHPSANGDNLFVIVTGNFSKQPTSFGSIESSWKWR